VAVLADRQQELIVETATGSGFPAVVETATTEGLTVYDAAYLSVAREQSLTLISEDAALRDAAEPFVAVDAVVNLGS
jgi:predicted nucleic acid-binding protein